jgi:RIO-like serine/threonine protein kinase
MHHRFNRSGQHRPSPIDWADHEILLRIISDVPAAPIITIHNKTTSFLWKLLCCMSLSLRSEVWHRGIHQTATDLQEIEEHNSHNAWRIHRQTHP